MYYRGYFRSNEPINENAGILYKVVIITNFRKNEFTYGGELMLSDSPFIVSYDSEDSNIFKPYKCSTATVGLLQENYNFEFSNTSGNNVLVMLLRLKDEYVDEPVSNKSMLETDYSYYNLEWIGFATPNTYSQEFENFYDGFELEAQDALSTLQFFPYDKKQVVETTFISFIEILINSCRFLRTYKNIYISDNINLPTSDEGDVMNFCIVDQRNFFDEDSKGKTYLEVIEQIMQYLNLTVIPYGDSLYVVDYTAIKKGINSYYHYKGGSSNIHFETDNKAIYTLQSSKKILEDSHDIKETDFSSTGTKLSLLSTYNKMSVKSSLYSYDSILDLDDKKRWKAETGNDTPKIYDEYNVIAECGGKLINNYQYREYKIRTDEDKDLYVFCNSRIRKDEKDKETDITKQKVYLKYITLDDSEALFNNCDVECYAYEKDKFLGQTEPNILGEKGNIYSYGNEVKNQAGYDFMRNHVCSHLIAYDTVEVDSFSEHPKKIDLKPAIFCSIPTDVIKWNDRWKDEGEGTRAERPTLIIKNSEQKLFTIKTKSMSVGSGEYFSLSFKVRFYYNNDCLPIQEEREEKTYAGENLAIGFDIKYNGKYLDNLNMGGRWVDEPYYLVSGLVYNHEEPTQIYSNDFEISNQYNFKDKLDVENGIVENFLYSVTENEVGTGEIEFSFYRPTRLAVSAPTCRGILISDIDIKIVAKSELNGINASDDNTDTEYSNVIDEESVVEKSGVDLDITTWDNKQPNYSSVMFSEEPYNKSNRKIFRVQHFFNRATGELLRAEEHIINNNVVQYSTPTVNLNMNLHIKPLPFSVFTYHFFKNKLFIGEGSELDYVNNSYNINLIEKK